MKQPAVYLVGVGPGDPGLITVRGLECIQAADVVVYEHFVHPRLLRQARPGAELLDVGSSSPNAMAQEAIGYLIADKAREGKVVAHLKWGDPFIFGRAGEEALFLHEQGIPFEVVPGVPAAVGAPAYAGVPLTYPGSGHTVTLVKAYDDEVRGVTNVDWASLAKLDGTVVCYAVANQMPRVVDALRSHGWNAGEQAVVVYNGTYPTQETLQGTLAELPGMMREQQRRGLAVLVLGRVVGFREHLRWFDDRPLFGRRVLVTRPREQAAELTERLAALGADPIEAPMIRIAPPEDPTPLLRAAAHADAFDWIVFTSANAVDAFMHALLDGERDIRALSGPLLCTVGSGTAERLARHGIRVDLVPDEFRADAVVRALARRGPLDSLRVLLPHADIGREVIADQLRAAGASVTDVVAYRTVAVDSPRADDPDVYRLLLEGSIDAVTFTSGSAVRNFAQLYGTEQAVDLLRQTVVATIGPVTTDAATELGGAVTVQPTTYTVPAMVEALAAHFAAARASAT